MQRIEEKHIDNSQLVPSRIAEQKTTFRQTKPIAPDLSGVVRSLQSAANLVNNIADFKSELDREIDEVAQIQVNQLFKNQELLALQELENKNPNDELHATLPALKETYYNNIQKELENIPMSKGMKHRVQAYLNTQNEALGIKLENQFLRKQVDYINNENLNYLQLSMTNGDTDGALKFYDTLSDRGVKLSITREEVKSNCTFNVLKEAIKLNDFSIIDDLQSRNKDGKYDKFTELLPDSRERLIKYGTECKNKLQSDNYEAIVKKIVNGEDVPEDEIKNLYNTGALSVSSYAALTKKTTKSKTTSTATNDNSAEIVKQIKGKIMLLDMPHANSINTVKSAWMTEIQKAFPDDLKTQADLIDLLNKELNDDPLEKSELGKDVKAYIKNIFTDLGTKGKNDTDNDEWGYYEDQNIVYAWQYDALYIARQLINKPGITMADIRTKIDEAVKFAAEKDIPRLINRANRIINPATYGKIYNARTTRQYISPGFMPRIVTESIIPKGHISPEQIVKKYNGKDNFDNEVEFWDIKNLDGSISTIIAEDYQTLN